MLSPECFEIVARTLKSLQLWSCQGLKCCAQLLGRILLLVRDLGDLLQHVQKACRRYVRDCDCHACNLSRQDEMRGDGYQPWLSINPSSAMIGWRCPNCLHSSKSANPWTLGMGQFAKCPMSVTSCDSREKGKSPSSPGHKPLYRYSTVHMCSTPDGEEFSQTGIWNDRQRREIEWECCQLRRACIEVCDTRCLTYTIALRSSSSSIADSRSAQRRSP